MTSYLDEFSSIKHERQLQLVAAAAQVLSEWPANFYGLLRRIGEASASKAPLATQFMKRHENVNGALFKKGIPPEEIKFLKEAFVRYAMEKWDGGIARFKSKALDGILIERKWMNRKEIAAHLGIGLPTVTKLQKTGQFAIERDEKKNSSYLFADRSKIGGHELRTGVSLPVSSGCTLCANRRRKFRLMRKIGRTL